jgi:signal transduction histidine kinase
MLTSNNTVLSLVLAATMLLVGMLVREMVQHRHSSQALESYIHFDALTRELSSRFVNVPVERIDSEIAYALGQLPKYLPNIRGVSILESGADANALLLTRSNVDLWNGTTRFKTDDLEWYTRQGLNNKEVVLMDVSQLPKESNPPNSILQDRGIGSSLSVALEASGAVVGTLTFHSVERGIQWSCPLVEQCRTLAQVFAGALLRKRSDHALTVSERIKDLILSFDGVHLVILDRAGTVVAVRNYFAGPSLCPITVGDSYIESFTKTLGRHSQAAVSARVGVQGVLSGERTQFHMEYPCDHERRQRWLAMTVIRLGDTNKLVAVVHRDVSKEKNSEQAVRELGGKLIRAQEEERSRIARELHDDISQRLALLTVDLRRVQDIAPECIDAEVSALCRKVDEITADIHGLSRCLHSTKLQLLGLGAALRGLCTECSRQNNINIECCCAELPTKPDPEISLSLFRVAQEALSNVLKHSHARNARVELACKGSDLSLRIVDDGLGFNRAQVSAQAGLGLVSMRERMHVIDGTLIVSSSPQRGTEIEARAPFKQEAQTEGSALGSAA